MSQLVPHHFEIPQLLFEFEVVVMARVDIEVLLDEIVVKQLHKYG